MLKLMITYTFLRAAFNADKRKMRRNAIITGAKTSNQPMLPVITFIIKRIALNRIPNEIKICLIPVCLVLLLATGDIFID